MYLCLHRTEHVGGGLSLSENLMHSLRFNYPYRILLYAHQTILMQTCKASSQHHITINLNATQLLITYYLVKQRLVFCERMPRHSAGESAFKHFCIMYFHFVDSSFFFIFFLSRMKVRNRAFCLCKEIEGTSMQEWTVRPVRPMHFCQYPCTSPFPMLIGTYLIRNF